ncbi:MAG: hypothetical protein DK302_001776 [Chloroflexi bacterium]|jgi:Flp pilus assembly protein TadB|nr:MAG: hypothetical protein DK302_001776 [Chloroflexota bacterium]
MPILINQYSFIVVSVAVLVIFGTIIWRAFNPISAICAILVVLIILIVTFISLRQQDNSFLNIDEFNHVLESGQPLLIEFYSDY